MGWHDRAWSRLGGLVSLELFVSGIYHLCIHLIMKCMFTNLLHLICCSSPLEPCIVPYTS